jgi:outer membrane protein assembly factor BamB
MKTKLTTNGLATFGLGTYFGRMTDPRRRSARCGSLAALCFAALALLPTTPSPAENWPQWRGPYFNGSTTEKGLPTQWSKTENVAWVAPMPGYSGSTPVVWEDAVFVASPDEHKNLLLVCLDRETGQVRWRKVVATGDRQKGLNNMASCSPVTDGKRVISLFATGDLAAFDYSGQELWKRDLGKEYGRFAIMWMYGSSPMLYRGKLYVQVLQHNPCPEDYTHAQDGKSQRESFLLCLDPATGTNVWRHVRPTDAIDESQEAYSTPIPCAGQLGEEILVVGADYVTAHSPETGEELWRCGGLNERKEHAWRLVPSVVVADGMIVACGPRRVPVLGIKDGGRGLVTEINIAWRFKEFSSDCVTPLYYQQKLYVLDGDRQVMTCLEPLTVAKEWQGNLGVREIFRASPTGADGKIYCVSESGTVVVLEAGKEFKVLSTIRMGEAPVRASIAVAHGGLFIRTAQNLYCVRNAGPGKP